MIKHLLISSALLSCLWVVLASAKQPLEDSELTLLMRSMADEMKKVKSVVLTDKFYDKWEVDYKHMLVATPSTEAKKGPKFNDFAKAFLTQLSRTQENKDVSQIRPQFNLLVNSCIHCHESFCPGPLSMLKKLRVPEL
ncbi:MAG: hypothetical protein KDC13_07850 [Bacteroidetes bacterium]|nr:hypothetical protein [Bacteroidota bacterium]